MKKRIIALSLAVLTLLCSCGQAVQEDPKELSSIYHIVVPFDEEREDTIYKINTLTGSYTTLCTDPVCNHNTDECISYRTNSVKRYGDTLFFRKFTGEGDDAAIYLYRMDLLTGSTEALFSSKKSDQHPIFSDYEYAPTDTCLFISVEKSDIPLEDIERGIASIDDVKTYYELYRFDYASKKTVLLGHGEDLTGFTGSRIVPVKADGETVTWSSPTKRITTDHNLGIIDVKEAQAEGRGRTKYCGDYKYNLVANTDYLSGVVFYDIYLVNQETNEEKPIAYGVDPQFVFLEDENTMVYRKYHDEPLVIFDKDETEIQQRNGKPSVDYTAGNIYAMNLDGTNNRLLCHIDDPYLDKTKVEIISNYSGLKANVNGTVLVELSHGYIGLTRDPDDYDEDGFPITDEVHCITAPQTEYLCGYAIVNIKTGEYKVVYPYGDPTMYAAQDRKEAIAQEMAKKTGAE